MIEAVRTMADESRRKKGGRPKTKTDAEVSFLLRMDPELRAFFDQVHVEAKRAARAAGQKIPAVNDLMVRALREWADRQRARRKTDD
jgi:hypothetical protein